METRNEIRNDRNPPVDEYARDSFRWRRMTPGQIAGLVVAAIIVAIALIWWDSARAAELSYAGAPATVAAEVSATPTSAARGAQRA